MTEPGKGDPPPANTLATRSAFQLAVERCGMALGAILLIGNLLDALSNAKSLVPPALTYIATLALPPGFFLLNVHLRRHPIRWVSRGTPYFVHRLGPRTIASLCGALILLWLPRTLDILGDSADLRRPQRHPQTVSLPARGAAHDDTRPQTATTRPTEPPETLHSASALLPSVGLTASAQSSPADNPPCSSLLNWTSTNATSLFLDHALGVNLPTQGDAYVSPARTTTYTITGTNSTGRFATASVTVVTRATCEHRAAPRPPPTTLLLTCEAATQPDVASGAMSSSSSCTIPYGVRIDKATLTYTLNYGGEVSIDGKQIVAFAPDPAPKNSSIELPTSLFSPGASLLVRVNARNATKADGSWLGYVYGKAVVQLFTGATVIRPPDLRLQDKRS